MYILQNHIFKSFLKLQFSSKALFHLVQPGSTQTQINNLKSGSGYGSREDVWGGSGSETLLLFLFSLTIFVFPVCILSNYLSTFRFLLVLTVLVVFSLLFLFMGKHLLNCFVLFSSLILCYFLASAAVTTKNKNTLGCQISYVI